MSPQPALQLTGSKVPALDTGKKSKPAGVMEKT